MIEIRQFQPADAQAVSGIIRKTMRESNSRDYPAEILQPLIEYFSPDKLIQLNAERFCLVAETGGQIIGTAAIENSELCTFFVLPDFQKKGVGNALLKEIEKTAFAEGIRTITVDSSLTAVRFYEKSGYLRTGVEKEIRAGRQIEMEKFLG